MIYTEQQAIEAIRQHPHLAAKMHLSPSELLILKSQGISFSTSDIVNNATGSAQNASRWCRRLLDKGYIKKIKNGIYVRL